MAGDWIKLDTTTPDKPEIVQMAQILKLDQDAVFGKCVRLWIWADQQTLDGNALSVTETFLDRITYCPGFAAALRQVGWLTGRDGRLSIPNFDRHNGQTAKKRALTKDRVGKSRERCNAASVTEALPEKRREEKSIRNTETQDAEASSVPQRSRSPSAVFRKPTTSEVIAYVREIGGTVDARSFVDHYEANGWKVGRNPMKDWKAAVRQWNSRKLEGGLYGRKPGNSAAEREQRNANAFDVIEAAAAASCSEGDQ